MWCSQWNQIYSLGPSQSVRMGQVACLTNMPRAGGECDAECQDARELKKKKKIPGNPTVVHSMQTSVGENHTWSHSNPRSVRGNYRLMDKS